MSKSERAIVIFRRLLVLLALLVGVPMPALATSNGPPVSVRGNNAVKARLHIDNATVSPGGTTQAAVELTPAAGWHLYGPEHGDAGAPPDATWALPRGVRAGAIVFPPSQRVVAQGLTTYEYHGPVTLRIPLSVAAGTKPVADAPIEANVTWLVCSNVCVPGRAAVTSVLGIVAAPSNTLASILPFVALAFAGGFILNLMPCVFPLLSFKALRAISEPREQRIRTAIAYVSGVTASCTALGAALLIARAAGNAVGWGFQLQSPWFVAFLAMLLVILALAMSGVIELTLPIPQRLARRAAAAGAFGDGMLVTLIGSACIAPYMGAALGFALSASVPAAIGVFIALGLGLALPYALLMVTPALLRWVPKPGRWMLIARRVLAVPLYVSALWLMWVFVQQVTPPVQNVAMQSTQNPTVFSTANLNSFRHARRAVLVDVSAAWCITCKVNERFALDRPDVTRRLSDLNVTVLRGDWTNQNPEITAYLHSLGTAGVPLYVYYPANGGVQVWPQILTPAIVIDHLKRA